MKKKGRGSGTAMRMQQIAIVALILVAFVAPSSAATLTVTPSSATVGDEITIEGTGFNATDMVTLKTTATCWKPVVGGKCECCMESFIIPENEDVSFLLSVREVEDNVTIYVKKFIWWTIHPDNPLGFHFTYNATTHTSNVSRAGVPAGTYTIDVIGNAVSGSVNCTMTTTVKKKLPVNSTGGFNETFDTQGIPICNLTINATDESGNSTENTLGLFLEGDASKDGQVNVYDCVCIARYAIKIPGYDDTTVCKNAADIDDDGDVDLEDARLLARYLIGLETSI